MAKGTKIREKQVGNQDGQESGAGTFHKEKTESPGRKKPQTSYGSKKKKSCPTQLEIRGARKGYHLTKEELKKGGRSLEHPRKGADKY